MQVISKPTREGALLDLLSTDKEKLDDIKGKGCVGSTDHKTAKFKIPR